ncbi:hypothetical protein HBH70_231670 [Parastagonospora nodorum]|nr:hypothetical protein HBH51_227950 [Parastagonospora nodorum]KAH4012143.1 hypothetical protein HBI09_224610 [Parastagonospora nodorum]KAH4056736.1 hypothetical protein HBH50_239650 [Parastagonospora nodorum]KAH4077781.1 hypothetical protein HBH48_237310 [Parastagonospora nodorum]KAH4215787.1 hypothetical protein HBI06_240470 [Parastagonospora nodorum]
MPSPIIITSTLTTSAALVLLYRPRASCDMFLNAIPDHHRGRRYCRSSSFASVQPPADRSERLPPSNRV